MSWERLAHLEVKYKSKRLEKTLKSDANIKKAFGKAATKVKARHNESA